jgi:hypothetical protein
VLCDSQAFTTVLYQVSDTVSYSSEWNQPEQDGVHRAIQYISHLVLRLTSMIVQWVKTTRTDTTMTSLIRAIRREQELIGNSCCLRFIRLRLSTRSNSLPGSPSITIHAVCQLQRVSVASRPTATALHLSRHLALHHSGCHDEPRLAATGMGV